MSIATPSPNETFKLAPANGSLPATLTAPKGAGPFPAIVLLHGSGPHDRDETIGPNKPFRDLAGGLAGQGVAVLRFEKRTKAYGLKLAKVKDLTVKEEIFDDALAAVALLCKTPGIAPKKIFVLGHSLGGMAAPRLAQLDPDIAGLIVMAGAARPIDDVIIEQIDYLLSLDKNATEKEKANAELIKKTSAKLTDATMSLEDLKSTYLLGANFVYWRSVREPAPSRNRGENQAAHVDPSRRTRLPGVRARLRIMEEDLGGSPERDARGLSEAEPFIH